MSEITPGIYLERKKGVIGTGSTAKEAVYRNFWMTIEQDGDLVHCVLLNNDFMLTSVREKFSIKIFEPPRFVYIPEGDKRYQTLKESLPTPKTVEATPRPETPPEPPKWWESPQKEIKPGDFFSRDESSAKQKPSSENEALDVFARPTMQGGQKVVSKKKPKKSEVITKKNWWSS